VLSSQWLSLRPGPVLVAPGGSCDPGTESPASLPVAAEELVRSERCCTVYCILYSTELSVQNCLYCTALHFVYAGCLSMSLCRSSRTTLGSTACTAEAQCWPAKSSSPRTRAPNLTHSASLKGIHPCHPPMLPTHATHPCYPPMLPTHATHPCYPPMLPTHATHRSAASTALLTWMASRQPAAVRVHALVGSAGAVQYSTVHSPVYSTVQDSTVQDNTAVLPCHRWVQCYHT